MLLDPDHFPRSSVKLSQSIGETQSKEWPSLRSAISPGRVGSHPSNSRVSCAEAGSSTPQKATEEADVAAGTDPSSALGYVDVDAIEMPQSDGHTTVSLVEPTVSCTHDGESLAALGEERQSLRKRPQANGRR
jgi:hypothetical protein